MAEPLLFVFDFDGTLVNSMRAHSRLGTDVIVKYFGIPKSKALEGYLATVGKPFGTQLQEIFPAVSEDLRARCAAEYHSRKQKEVYGNTGLFRDVKRTLETLRQQGHQLFVASSTEQNIVSRQLERLGIREHFSEVFGPEQGSKQTIVQRLLGEYPIGRVVFVGDAKTDVQLSKISTRIVTVGRAGKRISGLRRTPYLYAQGAQVVLKDLTALAQLNFERVAANRHRTERIVRRNKTKNPYPMRRVIPKRHAQTRYRL